MRELAADQVARALPLCRGIGVHLLADSLVGVARVEGEEGAIALLLLLEEGGELAARLRVLVKRLLAAAEESRGEALRLGCAVLVVHREKEEDVGVMLVRVNLADELVELVVRVGVLLRIAQLEELTGSVLASAGSVLHTVAGAMCEWSAGYGECGALGVRADLQ